MASAAKNPSRLSTSPWRIILSSYSEWMRTVHKCSSVHGHPRAQPYLPFFQANARKGWWRPPSEKSQRRAVSTTCLAWMGKWKWLRRLDKILFSWGGIWESRVLLPGPVFLILLSHVREENFEKAGRESGPLWGGEPHCLKYPGSLEEQSQVKDE